MREIPAHITAALASLEKAWPVLAQHASHIDGEFCNAVHVLKRHVEAVAMTSPEPPAHKGVTYRDGKWHRGPLLYSRASAVIEQNTTDFTDEDHAPLVALKQQAERVPTLERCGDCDSCMVGAKCPYALPVVDAQTCEHCGNLLAPAALADADAQGVAEAHLLDGWYLVERNKHVYQQASEASARAALAEIAKREPIAAQHIRVSRLALADADAGGEPFDARGARRLAEAAADLVRRGVIGSRSPLADALLDFAPDLCTMEPRTPDADAGVAVQDAREAVVQAITSYVRLEEGRSNGSHDAFAAFADLYEGWQKVLTAVHHLATIAAAPRGKGQT